MSTIQWLTAAIAIVLIALFSVLFVVTEIEKHQAQNLQTLNPAAPTSVAVESANSSKNLVVYFSRSGNTALAARHIAGWLQADTIVLQVEDYQLGISGLANAIKDADQLKTDPAALPDIKPASTDMTAYDTVWLGSPVWLYSPAPPIWAFIENNRFDGKKVVLFNTYNSHFANEHIDRFREKVMAKGAVSFEHKHVIRGRMTQQITPEEMLKTISEAWFNNI